MFSDQDFTKDFSDGLNNVNEKEFMTTALSNIFLARTFSLNNKHGVLHCYGLQRLQEGSLMLFLALKIVLAYFCNIHFPCFSYVTKCWPLGAVALRYLKYIGKKNNPTHLQAAYTVE